MAKKVQGLTLYNCSNYSCRMTKDACARLKKKSKMPKTKIMFLHWNELTHCRDCSGVK